jgi:hypothetical protein
LFRKLKPSLHILLNNGDMYNQGNEGSKVGKLKNTGKTEDS